MSGGKTESGGETLSSPPSLDGVIEHTTDGWLPSPVSSPGAVVHRLSARRRGLIRSIIGLVIAAGVVGLGTRLLGGSEATDDTASAPPETTEIQLRDLAETEEYTGQLQYEDAVPVSASGSGYLTDLAEEGTVLERGDVLYSLSNDPTEAQLLAAQQQVSSAQSQLASANEQRSSLTAGPGASELSSAQAAVAAAELSLERLVEPPTEAELASAQAQLAQAEEAYSALFAGPDSSETAALEAEVTRANQSYDQAIAASDLAFITLLSAQAEYCALDPAPVTDLCAASDLPLSDSDVSNLTTAVQTALAAGDNATVAVIQAFISASGSYANALASVSSTADALTIAGANLSNAYAAPSQVSIDQALATLYQAQESLRQLYEGPDALEATQAEASLAAAQARLDELLEGASAAERQQAAAAVESARLAFEISQLELSELVKEPTFVSVFYGEAVSWRTLSLGSSPGPDIRQLKENLAALGFDPEGSMAIDDVFDEATKQAVMRWQESLSTTVDGSVSVTDLIYTPGPVKVRSVAEGTELGNAITAGTVLTELVPISRVTAEGTGTLTEESTQRIVVSLPVDDRDLIEEGSEVTVQLADDTELEATVASIGTPVSGESGSTVEVVVVPTEPIDDSWTGTNVTVVVTSELAEDVLAVPVSALLALLEGGYAVEVVEADGSTRLVGVETGMFADGLVEISGEGLSAGMSVVVP